MSSSTPHATNKPHTPDLRPPPHAQTRDNTGQNETFAYIDGPLKPQQSAPRLPAIPEKRDTSGQNGTLASANRVPNHEPTVPTPKVRPETCDISGQSGTFADTPHPSCRHLPLRRPTSRFRAEPRLSPWADLQVGDISGQNETFSDTLHPNCLPTRVTFRDMMGHALIRRLRIPAPAHCHPAPPRRRCRGTISAVEVAGRSQHPADPISPLDHKAARSSTGRQHATHTTGIRQEKGSGGHRVLGGDESSRLRGDHQRTGLTRSGRDSEREPAGGGGGGV